VIENVTATLSAQISRELEEAIDAITVLNRYIQRGPLSAAIGELSERLVAGFAGAEMTNRNSPGHDLKLPNGELIEVKSRFLSHWGDKLQFNFGSHSKCAHEAYCLISVAKKGERPRLDLAFRMSVPYLLENWGTPRQKRYCARTNLGKLRAITQPRA
jgi:hypothetical protein